MSQKRSKINWIIISVLGILAMLSIALVACTKKEKTIKIGAILSITGPGKNSGEDVRDGILLAAEEINAWGGINGRKIELIIEDGKSNLQESKEAFKKIEANYRPMLYVSTLSTIAMALAPLAGENKVVLVGLIAVTPDLSKQNEWTFKYYATAESEVRATLPALRELKIKKLGILYLDDEYGRSIFEEMVKEFEKAGGVVRGKSFQGNIVNYKDIIEELKDMEAIYAVGFSTHLITIFEQLKKEGFKGPVFAPSPSTLPDITSLKEANGAYVAAPIIYNPKFILAKEAKDKYEAKYHKLFNHYAANGYDFIKLLPGLIEDQTISRDNIRKLLEQGFTYPGIFGTINVTLGEHDISFPLHPARIENKELKYTRSN